MIYPNQCYIEITDKCNLKCLHCFANGKMENNNFITLEQIKEIYKGIENLGVIYINISGGEPLINPEFFSIMEYVVKQPYQTTLLTNGILWNETLIKKLGEIDKERRIVVQVSIDGEYEIMSKQRNLTLEQYNNFLNNISLFKRNDFIVTGIHVADALTIDNSLKTLQFYLKEIKLDSVQIVPIFSSGRATENKEVLGDYWNKWDVLVNEITDIKKFNLWDKLSDIINVGFFTLYELVIPLDNNNRHEDIKNVWGLDVDDPHEYYKQTRRRCYCEAGQSELAISADLELYPCVAAIRTNLKCGNLKCKDIGEIWSKNDILSLFRGGVSEVAEKEPCKSCTYKEICLGGCRVVALEELGDFYAPDPRCPKVKSYQEELKYESS